MPWLRCGVRGGVCCASIWSLALSALPCSLQYYKEVHGVIYAIDSTDRDRLRDSKDAFGPFAEPPSGAPPCISLPATTTAL